MSPSTKPVRDIKVHVPRHNSQRIGPAVTAQVETLARAQHVRVDVRETARESSSALAQAVESASEWNSLLMTARAERGPQWDIGTQQFFVDEASELYYDPTPLLEYQKENGSPEDSSEKRASTSHQQQQQQLLDYQRSPHHTRSSSHRPHTPQRAVQQYFNAPPQHVASPRHGYPGVHNMGYGGMNPVSPAQFYGAAGRSVPDPQIGMGMSPGMGMGIGGGGRMGMNMGMGMHAPDNMGMGMGMAIPDAGRRMTRGMSAEDQFAGMR